MPHTIRRVVRLDWSLPGRPSPNVCDHGGPSPAAGIRPVLTGLGRARIARRSVRLRYHCRTRRVLTMAWCVARPGGAASVHVDPARYPPLRVQSGAALLAYAPTEVPLLVDTLTIGVALYGDITFDSRVRREAASLADAGYRVVLLCLDGAESAADLPDRVEVRSYQPTKTKVLPWMPNSGPVPSSRRPGVVGGIRWLVDYLVNLRDWGRWAVDTVPDAAVWHLHDLTALAAVAPLLSSHRPFVYDSHELFLEAASARQFPSPVRWALGRLEARLVSKAAAVVTVNEAVGAELLARYKPRRLIVVHNCPDIGATGPDASPLRGATNVATDEPLALYHGSLGSHRGIEQAIQAIADPRASAVHLALMGMAAPEGVYQDLASRLGVTDRVHVLDAVPPGQLLDWVRGADIGLMPIQPSTLNHRLSTPNKLFECIAAGVPVVASDFEAIRRVVMDQEGPLGDVCDPTDPSAIARSLRSLLEASPDTRREMRHRCLSAARREWNWDVQVGRLVDLYRSLAAGPT